MEDCELRLRSSSSVADYSTKLGQLKKLGRALWKVKQLELDGLTLRCYDPKDSAVCFPPIL